MLTRILLLIAATSAATASADSADYARAMRESPGLLLYFRFENSDQGISDASGRQHNAAVAGDVRHDVDSAYASLGRAIRLNKGGHLKLPDLGEQQAVSIEFWIKAASAPAEGIAGLYAGDGWSSKLLHLNFRDNGRLELAIHDEGRFVHSDPGGFTVGQWTHVVATYDGATGAERLYVNGRKVMEDVAQGRPSIRLASAAVGSWINGSAVRPLEADLDEFAIYAFALPEFDVKQHYLAAQGIQLAPESFAHDVLPLLTTHCLECHGPDAQEGSLRLDVRDWSLRGGESGEPAYIPFDSGSSHLIQLVTSQDEERRMPQGSDPLSEEEIAVLRNWIDQGAPWPDELAGDAKPESTATSHWSFQPIIKHSPPASDDPFVTTGNVIDAFIFDALAKKNLKPSPPADRRTLLRRLYLDVHGLPPTPEQVREFVEDPSPQAWEKQIESVLASPRYAERWASHWLDVVRYGETHGFEVNTPRDHAWPYRDYVIKSLHEDKPYRTFIREQVAGDQLKVDSATGFLVAAPALLQGQIGKDEASIRQARADELHEVIVSVSAGVMGITAGCARCHNHKFDPISQRDYYQLQAFFTGLHYGDRPIRDPEEVRLTEAGTTPATQIFGGVFSHPDPAHRLFRGDPMQRRERVAPDIPAVFGSLELPPDSSDAGRRLALADWLVSADNPLTSRVIVNRVWQHHFGLGIVQTPSDFGAMGFKPSHPELLDWLAANFVEEGWSLKSLHRLILQSNAYRQASVPRSDAIGIDANSELLWRFPPRRLEMEPIRDSILAVSGSLDLSMGGPGFMLFKPNDNYVRVYEPKEEWGPAEWRRMVYSHRVRMAQDGVFGTFDCPDAGQPAPKRSRSTTALQALNLLNSTFIKQQAELLAKRAMEEASRQSCEPIQRLFELALARQPSPQELAASQAVAGQFGLPAVARALFNTNEFLFLP